MQHLPINTITFPKIIVVPTFIKTNMHCSCKPDFSFIQDSFVQIQNFGIVGLKQLCHVCIPTVPKTCLGLAQLYIYYKR